MSKKKTSADLAADIRRLEERLRQAKEEERRVSKAEEARTNADVIKAVKDYWEALPSFSRPEWADMPEHIRTKLITRGEGNKKDEQEDNKDEFMPY